MQVYTVYKRRVLAVAAFLFLGLFFLSSTPVEQVPDPEGEEGHQQVTKHSRAVHAISRAGSNPSSHSTTARWARDNRKRTEWQPGDNRTIHHHQRAADSPSDRTERRKPHRDTQSINEEEEEEDEDYGEYGADDIIADEGGDNEEEEEDGDDVDYEQLQDRKVFKEGDFDDVPTPPSSSPNNGSKTSPNCTWHKMSTNNTGDLRTQGYRVVCVSGGGKVRDYTLNASSSSTFFKTFPSLKDSATVKPHRHLEQKQGRRRRVTTSDKYGTPVVEDFVYWAKEVEDKTPKGFTDEEAGAILQRLRHQRVIQMEPPTWNRCGRPKNQFLVFEDGSRACARYRAPHDYLVQGEVMSFYLSRLLGIHNVPVVALASVNNGTQWRNSRVNKILQAAGWSPNATVAIIQWIDHLERDKMPHLILQALLNQQVISRRTSELHDLKGEKLVELLQWSDLILFDYITGNYDRVASMQDAADKEKRPSILRETIHNLVKSRSTRGLWLIDNESGLLDSYSLLYSHQGQAGGDQDVRFLAFHRAMLRTICVFRRLTVERVAWLCNQDNAHRILAKFVSRHEPLFASMPEVNRSKEFTDHFQSRVCEVDKHVRWCKRQARKL